MPEKIRAQLEGFTVNRNGFDRFIFERGHILLLLSVIFTCSTFLFNGGNLFSMRDTLRWFDLMIYLFAALVGIVEFYAIRDFFKRIPTTFTELMNRNAITKLDTDPGVGRRFSTFLDTFEKRLNISVPVFFVPGIMAVSIFALITSRLLPLPSEADFPIGAIIINSLTVLVPICLSVYAICVFGWKCLVTGYALHQFSSSFGLSLQPSHPDRTSGLKPIGDLVFSMALILIIASLASSILVVFATPLLQSIYKAIVQIAPHPNLVVPPPFMAKTILAANAFLGGVLILSLVVFFIPLISAHQRMQKEKLGMLAEMTLITNRIAELERQSRSIKAGHTKRNEFLAEIDSLTKTYNILNKTPVWPFDREMLLKFVTPQAASLLSFFGVVEPVANFISSWLKG